MLKALKEDKILGFPVWMFIIVDVIMIFLARMDWLLTDMVGALAFALSVGTLLGWIGDHIPVWNTWFGGGMLFTCLCAGAMNTFGLVGEKTIEALNTFNGSTGFLNLYILVLITGSVLSIDRKLLIKSFAGYIPTILGGVVCALGLAGIYAFGGRLGGFLYEASELLHGRWDDDFGSGRLYIWRNVAELVRERPLLGGGPDTLGLRTEAAFERYDEALGILIRSSVDAAHNEYLNILVNQGLLALAAYLGALVAAAVRWVRTAAEKPASAICGGAVLGYCVQAFFGISSPISAPYLWLALGFLIGSVFDNSQGGASRR